MRIIENERFKITIFDQNVYLYETNQIEIIRKQDDIPSIKINGNEYFFYSQQNIIIEVSDYLRSYVTGFVEINNYDVDMTTGDDIVYNIPFTGIKGFIPIIKELVPPTYIPYDYNFLRNNQLTFYLSIFLPEYVGYTFERKSGNAWINLGNISGNPETRSFTPILNPVWRIKDIDSVIIGSTFDASFDSTFVVGTPMFIDNSLYIKGIQTKECIDYIYIIWMGENGTRKSWFFEKKSIVRSSNTVIDTFRYENPDGYNVFKDKLIDFELVVSNATDLIKKYLADIVISDDVTAYPFGKPQRCNISNKSIETKEYSIDNELSFTLNYKQYSSF